MSDVRRYIRTHKAIPLEDKEEAFHNLLRYISTVKQIDADTRILEIGTGTGWFPIFCRLKGLSCKALEVSPELIEYARELGASRGVEPDIELGNLEESDLGVGEYDVVIASSLFEHLRDWREGLRRIYVALRPGGVLFFESTNKFSLKSGEFPSFPLYGWLPNALRYRLRVAVHGADIMRYGIDFHQFTYPRLRRAFREIGFVKILDRVDLADLEFTRSGLRRKVLRLSKNSRVVKEIVLCFFECTTFVCVK